MVNAQTWLDKNYPQEERSKITELDISGQNLEGELDLSDFVNCQELNCASNKLTSLNLSNCSQLELIYCSNNLLTNLTLPTNLTNLKKLNLEKNNFPAQDLSFLTLVTKLEYLHLGNDEYLYSESGEWVKEKINQNIYNRFTGSLNYLSGMEKLKELDISNTDINEININQLPKSLKKIEYFTGERPNCQLTTIIPQLDKYFGEFGRCLKCLQANTSKGWCQPCAEQEWKQDLTQLTEQEVGQELIEKFIEKQRNLEWIPYEQFTDIEYLASGGFSEIHKAIWKKGGKEVALKILNNSQNITHKFLTEIANTKLVDGYHSSVVKCYGISQDPNTKDYIMVMQYMAEGNLRDYYKNNAQELTWEGKLYKLVNIADGLTDIHHQNLIHQDLHSGNILNDLGSSFITDLGLSKSVNSQSRAGEIFGVLPYVAPEILQNKPYAPASDIYSFGIIAYELLSGLPPYYDRSHGLGLQLKICQGLRPQFQIKIPPLLEELINRCWDADPGKRPSAEELFSTLDGWYGEIIYKKNTEFTQQVQVAETYNQNLPKEIKYPKVKIHLGAVYHSKVINTQQITQLLEKYHNAGDLSIDINDHLSKLNINDEQTELVAQIEVPPK